MNKNIQRYNHIDLMKTIGIFFVILYHSRLYINDFIVYSNIGNFLVYFLKGLTSTCVPIFFFVNGYLLFTKEFDLKKHIKKTIKLVLLAFFWELILLISYLTITGQKFELSNSLIISYLSLDINYCLTIFWFIGSLVVIYLLFPILKNVYDNNKTIFKYFVLMSFIFTFGINLLNEVLNIINYLANFNLSINYEVFNMYNPFIGIKGYTFVYFCLGGLIHYYEKDILSISKYKRNIIAFILLLLSLCALFSIGVYHSIVLEKHIWDIVWNGFDTIFTLLNVVSIYILFLNYNKTNKLVMNVSKNTLGIYFIHVILIESTKKLIPDNTIFLNIITKVFYGIIILLTCTFICKIIKKIPILKKLV